jgi:sugar/nucleoside kinase (ribokinase family)
VTPNAEEFQAAGEALADRAGGAHCLITRGPDGVDWRRPDGSRRRVPAVAAHVVNPVGAGDAFVAGLVHALSRAWDWEAAVSWAVAVSGASTEVLGIGDVDPARAEALWRQAAAGDQQGGGPAWG